MARQAQMDDKPAQDIKEIFTIGHSNHSLETFINLLIQHKVRAIIDVRSRPYSRHAPHFNKSAIQSSLQEHSIHYIFMGQLLGGLPDNNEFYDKNGSVLYDRLADSAEFHEGIRRVMELLENSRTALLCGEENPLKCHRRFLVGRELSGHGVAVFHIRADGKIQREEELAKQQEFRRTQGQLSLFEK